jgi:hypothetical protein
MSKSIRITYYGMDGEGPTVKAAKEDAGRKLARLVAETEEAPVIIAADGVAAIVAYSKWGWGHRLITAQESGLQTGQQFVSGNYETRHEAELAALRHVLDIAWRFPRDDTAWLDETLVGKVGTYLTRDENKSLRADLLERWAWQRRYRAAREAGNSDEDARYIASGLHHLVKTADGTVTVCSVTSA